MESRVPALFWRATTAEMQQLLHSIWWIGISAALSPYLIGSRYPSNRQTLLQNAFYCEGLRRSAMNLHTLPTTGKGMTPTKSRYKKRPQGLLLSPKAVAGSSPGSPSSWELKPNPVLIRAFGFSTKGLTFSLSQSRFRA